jgi:hypothetical protein
VSADQLIAGLRQIAERAHEHGLLVYAATITPCEGANYILLPAYDGGDYLHLNDAGFKVLAESIDLGLFALT